MNTPKPPGRYHHGDLRHALVEAALDVIAEEGVDAISLRQLARKIGVTTAAPYHHFKDKEAVLAAVAAEGFRALNDEVDRSTGDLTEPAARFRAMGAGYIRFAVSHPSHYQAMFRPELRAPELYPELDRVANLAFDRLLQAIGAVRPELGPEQVGALAILSWSTVHGFSMLWSGGAITFKVGLDRPEPLIDLVTDHCVRLVASAEL